MKKGLVLSILAGIFSIASVSAAWTFTAMLNQWDQMGIFNYALPFLLIFALVYGILNKSKIFGDENKGAVVIISLAIGLLSLVGNYVSNFFKIIMPNLAIGLSVLLCGIILVGLLWQEEKIKSWLPYVIFGLGAIIFIYVVYGSFSGNSWGGSYVWDQYGSALVTLLILGGIIWAVIGIGKNP
jgi:hypothetical protein